MCDQSSAYWMVPVEGPISIVSSMDPLTFCNFELPKSKSWAARLGKREKVKVFAIVQEKESLQGVPLLNERLTKAFGRKIYGDAILYFQSLDIEFLDELEIEDEATEELLDAPMDRFTTEYFLLGEASSVRQKQESPDSPASFSSSCSATVVDLTSCSVTVIDLTD